MTDFIYERVMNAVNEVDPMKLFKTGCPADEYAPEVRLIVSNVTCGKKVTVKSLKEVFETMFFKNCCNDSVYEELERSLNKYL